MDFAISKSRLCILENESTSTVSIIHRNQGIREKIELNLETHNLFDRVSRVYAFGNTLAVSEEHFLQDRNNEIGDQLDIFKLHIWNLNTFKCAAELNVME